MPLIQHLSLQMLVYQPFHSRLIFAHQMSTAPSNRPTHEMLNPNLLDQTVAFERQFSGMSDVAFNYDDYLATRHELINQINTRLTQTDKDFLMSLNRLAPDWSIYNYETFPSVKWKLLNLKKFSTEKPKIYRLQLEKLEQLLWG